MKKTLACFSPLWTRWTLRMLGHPSHTYRYRDEKNQDSYSKIPSVSPLLKFLLNKKSPLSTSIIHKTPSEHKPEKACLREEGSARLGFRRASVERGSRGALLVQGVKGSSPSWGGGVAELAATEWQCARGPVSMWPESQVLGEKHHRRPFPLLHGAGGLPQCPSPAKFQLLSISTFGPEIQ